MLCGGKEVGALCILFRKHNELYHLSLKDYCWKSVIFTSTVIINRQRIQEIGYFDENMKYCEDMNYYQRFFKWNQVYYLPKKLILYGSNREYYGQAGLSSHLKEMHMGRAYNFKILRKDKQISNLFYIVMICFGNVKYLRRILLIKKASKNKK